MMLRLLALLLALVAGRCWAVTIAAPPAKGPLDVVTLASGQSATGLGANAIDTRNGFRTLTIQVTNTGTSSTVQVAQSCDGGAHWGDLTPLATWGSAVPDTATVPNQTVTFMVQNPMCSYTINVTAVTAASITAIALVGAKVQ
jgi:hypothetical protein